jgi:hypothetical protein
VAFDPVGRERDAVGVVGRGELISALVGPVAVEVGLEVSENLLGVASIEQQDIVGSLLAGRTHEPLGVRIAVR